MDFKNRVIVITGATGGLGKVAARSFAEAGASLALLSNSPDLLAQQADELGLPESRLLTGVYDLLTPQGAHEFAKTVRQHFGKADILLHLVGGWTGGTPLVELEAAHLTSMLNQHAWTTFHALQAFLPLLLANGWGRIIAITSPFAEHPGADLAAYAAGKAAQEALILSAAGDHKGSGVTANVIRVKTIDPAHQKLKNPNPDNASWTTPEEITAAIMYLCSAAGGVVNGARVQLYS